MIDRDEIIEFTRDNIGEIVSGFCIFLLVMLLFMLKRQYTIGIIALVSITAVGIERRAKSFDKVVSVLVIFFLATGFMFFD